MLVRRWLMYNTRLYGRLESSSNQSSIDFAMGSRDMLHHTYKMHHASAYSHACAVEVLHISIQYR